MSCYYIVVIAAGNIGWRGVLGAIDRRRATASTDTATDRATATARHPATKVRFFALSRVGSAGRLWRLGATISGCLSLTLFFVVNDAVEIPGAFLKLPIEDGDLLCGRHRTSQPPIRLHPATGARSRPGLIIVSFGTTRALSDLAGSARRSAVLARFGTVLRSFRIRRSLALGAVIFVKSGQGIDHGG